MTLLLGAVVANAAELRCQYGYHTFPQPYYECDGKITTMRSDFIVNTVSGNHITGKTNDEVSTVIIRNVSMEVMPRNLNTWFKNFREIAISSIPNFAGFKRSDLSDYTQLTTFYIGYLPMIRKFDRETFWDLRELTHLYIEEMISMGNLDKDLLMNARNLGHFSARGPNRITEIPAGFFRNQGSTLRIVDFRRTNLIRVSFTVFQNVEGLKLGRFYDAGCLDSLYDVDVIRTLTQDIQTRCQDVTERRNDIAKKSQSSSSSSSDSSTEEK